MTLRERFDAKWIPEPNSGCWLWLGALFVSGYGWFQRGHRKQPGARANRISWELHRGPIPDGLCVLHRCDNPSCVNPDHLFIGTQLDNIADRDRKGRQARGVRHPRHRDHRRDVRA